MRTSVRRGIGVLRVAVLPLAFLALFAGCAGGRSATKIKLLANRSVGDEYVSKISPKKSLAGGVGMVISLKKFHAGGFGGVISLKKFLAGGFGGVISLKKCPAGGVGG